MNACDAPRPAALSVIGLGNPGMGDDAVGMVIAELLEEQRQRGEWGAGAEVLAAGMDPTVIAASLVEGRRVLVVDAVDMGQAPGTWRMISLEEVLGAAAAPGRSTHSLPLAATVRLARVLGCDRGLSVLGIQIGSTDPGAALSPGVRACLPSVLQVIREEAEVLS